MEKFAIRIICLLFGLTSFAAIAAVHDPAGSIWSFLGSTVTHTDELFFFATSYIGVGLLICTAIALTIGKKWLVTCMILLLTVLSYMLVKVFVLNIDYIMQAGLEEHLISPLYATTITLMIMIVLLAVNTRKHFFS